MAWRETCELEARNLIKVKMKKGNLSARKATIEVAKETGVPFGTLDRWFYNKKPKNKKSYPRNEVTLVRKVLTIDNGQRSKFEIETCDIKDERFLIIQEYKPKTITGKDEPEFRPTLNRIKIPIELVDEFQAFFADLKEEGLEAEPEDNSTLTVPLGGAPNPEPFA